MIQGLKQRIHVARSTLILQAHKTCLLLRIVPIVHHFRSERCETRVALSTIGETIELMLCICKWVPANVYLKDGGAGLDARGADVKGRGAALKGSGADKPFIRTYGIP
ncbi:hypothetical protein M758_11G165000 [Ceratodon purpureus]|nr:hypothetical protein M758_11G165000 [Ceratodon purpureus]